jgi:hypothetical protein
VQLHAAAFGRGLLRVLLVRIGELSARADAAGLHKLPRLTKAGTLRHGRPAATDFITLQGDAGDLLARATQPRFAPQARTWRWRPPMSGLMADDLAQLPLAVVGSSG